jgi:hypothetical protein
MHDHFKKITERFNEKIGPALFSEGNIWCIALIGISNEGHTGEAVAVQKYVSELQETFTIT